MPRATFRTKSNRALIELSTSYPKTKFTLLGAWPVNKAVRTLIQTSDLDLTSLQSTLDDFEVISDVEIRYVDENYVLIEATTPWPEPHGATSKSGIVPSYPLQLENGWLVGEIAASRCRISEFRQELENAEIEYRLERISDDAPPGTLLTDRQQEVITVAIEEGYYDMPRECSLTDLADSLKVNKSVISRVLHRAEGRIVTEYYESQ